MNSTISQSDLGPLHSVSSNGELRSEGAIAMFKYEQPAEIAAKAFFGNDGSRDWKSLPKRLERLSHVFENWVSEDF